VSFPGGMPFHSSWEAYRYGEWTLAEGGTPYAELPRYALSRAAPRSVQRAAHQLDEGLLRGPLAGEARGRRDRGRQRHRRMERQEQRQPLGGDPDVGTAGEGRAIGPPGHGQGVEQPLPAGARAFLGGDEAEGEQGVVELVRRFGVGPGLGAGRRGWHLFLRTCSCWSG
jgi:hypothetical protein